MENANSTGRLRPWLPVFVVLTVTWTVFSRVVQQGFVDWDDELHVYENPHLGSLAGVFWLWHHPYGGLFVPLSYTAYALLAWIARGRTLYDAPGNSPTPLDPHVFHLANLALHLGNTLLVYLLLQRLLRRDWAAAAGALLYGVHPMQVETVAWVSELRGLLCSGFSLLCCWLHVRAVQRTDLSRRGQVWAFVAASFCFLCALLCKPNAVIVPLVILALDWGFLGRSWRRSVPPMLPWLALSGAWLCLTRGAQPLQFHPLPLWTRPGVAGDALGFYVSHLLWPAKLGPDYGQTPVWAMAHHGWAVALIVGVSLVWIAMRCRDVRVLGALAIFLAALLPVLGLVPFAFQLYSTVSDRYMSLALLGPALLIGLLMVRVETVPRLRAAIPLMAVVILTAFAVRSLAQVPAWDNALSFTSNALAVNPRSWVMHYNRGKYWEAQGDDARAAGQYREAIADNPNDADAHSNLGNLLLRAHQFGQADTQLRAALALEPALPQPRVVLALSLGEQGQNAAAVTQWEIAVRAWPQAAVLRYNLGIALFKVGRIGEATTQFTQVLQQQPQFAPAQAALAQAQRASSKPQKT